MIQHFVEGRVRQEAGTRKQTAVSSGMARARKKDAMENQEVAQVHDRKYQRVDRSRGRMLDFGVLVEQFGIHYDRARAIRLGSIYAKQLTLMRGGWLDVNPISKSMRFCFLDSEWSADFTESWSMYEKSFTITNKTELESEGSVENSTRSTPVGKNAAVAKIDGADKAVAQGGATKGKGVGKGGVGKGDAVGAGGGSDGGGASGAGVAVKKKKGGGGAGGKGGGGGGGDGDGKTPRAPQTLEEMQKEAQALKRRYHVTVSTSLALQSRIGEVNKMAFLDNDQKLGELNQLHAAMMESVKSSEFNSLYLVTPVSEIKKHWGNEHLTVNLKKFLKMSASLEKLELSLLRLGRLQKANDM